MILQNQRLMVFITGLTFGIMATTARTPKKIRIEPRNLYCSTVARGGRDGIVSIDPILKHRMPHLKQFCVITQNETSTCGYHAGAHVAAIQHLVDTNQIISSTVLRGNSQQYLNQCEYMDTLFPRGLSNVDILQLPAVQNVYDSLFFSWLDRNNCMVTIQGLCETSFSDVVKTIEDIKHAGKGCAHFICKVIAAPDERNLSLEERGHWVALSLVIQPGTKPMIVFCDSSNEPLGSYYDCGIIEHLYHECLRSYTQA